MSALIDLRRSAGIDLMRGLCVLLVVMDHIDLRFRINQFDVSWLMPEALRQVIFRSGYFSVIVFFVISGFLITTLSLRRWGSLHQIHVRQFYWLRFARIGPCLLALVVLLSSLHWLQATGFVVRPERGTLAQAVLAAFTFHFNWLEGRQGYFPGAWDILWSLSVEEAFYLAFPLICLLCRRERWFLAPLALLILIGPFYRAAVADRDPWNEYAYLSCADALSLGCLAGLLGVRLRILPVLGRGLMAVGLVSVLLIVVFRGTASALGVPGREVGVSILALGVALILFSMAQGIGGAISLPGTRLVQAVGRSSYEIYMTHMLVLMGLMPIIVRIDPRTSIPLWYVALLFLSVALGTLVRLVYSEPLRNL